MEPRYRFRLYLLTALILAGCGTLLSRLYEFQIERRAEFVAKIPTTENIIVPEPGVRGEIIDRHGETLAKNQHSYEIVLNLEAIYKDFKKHEEEQKKNEGQKSEEPLPSTEEAIAAMAEQEETEIDEDEIVRIVRTWVVPKLELFGLKGKRFTKAIGPHFRTHQGRVPYIYRTDLSAEEFAQIAVRAHELEGVDVRVMPRRVYPYGSLGSHFLGYVDHVITDFQGEDEGIAGVELTANKYLKGERGMKVLVRDDRRQIIETEDYRLPREGAQVQLTIDAEIQFIIENVLRRIGRGAAVVMDPETGEVLAMASVPNYDPNHFVPSISAKVYNAYLKNPADPLINRAIRPYLPGSTYKLPTALAAVSHDQTGRYHNCIGYTPFGKYRIKCWKIVGHGSLGLSESLQRSCNPYFMGMAGKLGHKTLAATFDKLGFGVKSGIMLPNETEGLYIGSPIWKQDHPGAVITPAQIAMMAIGQDKSLASPLQICAVTATIANGGKYYQPRIIRRVVGKNLSGESIVLKENIPIVKADLLREGVSQKNMEVIRHGMWKAVNQIGGTATDVKMADVEIAAKTGTAQVSETSTVHSHNAWTTSFAPYDSPRYAVTVLVVNGTSGGKVAGALSEQIYRQIFALEAGVSTGLSRLGVYEGNLDSYEKIERPDGDLFASADAGETGGEIDAGLLDPTKPIKVTPNVVPTPSIAPEPDKPDDGDEEH